MKIASGLLCVVTALTAPIGATAGQIDVTFAGEPSVSITVPDAVAQYLADQANRSREQGQKINKTEYVANTIQSAVADWGKQMGEARISDRDTLRQACSQWAQLTDQERQDITAKLGRAPCRSR